MPHVAYLNEIAEMLERYQELAIRAKEKDAFMHYSPIFKLCEFSLDEILDKNSRFYRDVNALLYLRYLQIGIVPESIDWYDDIITKPAHEDIISVMNFATRCIDWLVIQPIMQQDNMKVHSRKKKRRYHEMAALYIERFDPRVNWAKRYPNRLPTYDEKYGIKQTQKG